MMRMFTIGLTLSVCRVAAGDGVITPGERVPNLSEVRWIRGGPVSNFETGRVYVLEFWSTWCAACVESIDELNRLARRYEKDASFIAIHVWQKEAAPKPAAFLEARSSAGKAIVEFPVAEDVEGATATAWLDATQSTGLPTAMIVDRTSRLVWFGHSRDLEGPLKEVVDGTFDVSRSLTEMNLRFRVGRLAKESDDAIDKGEFDEGIRLMLEALAADPGTVTDWIPSSYGHLLIKSRSPATASRFADAVLATEAGEKKDLLAGLANAILHFPSKEHRDLGFALRQAQRANAMYAGLDAKVVCLVARLQAENGQKEEAVRFLERAIQGQWDAKSLDVLTQTLVLVKDQPGG